MPDKIELQNAYSTVIPEQYMDDFCDLVNQIGQNPEEITSAFLYLLSTRSQKTVANDYGDITLYKLKKSIDKVVEATNIDKEDGRSREKPYYESTPSPLQYKENRDRELGIETQYTTLTEEIDRKTTLKSEKLDTDPEDTVPTDTKVQRTSSGLYRVKGSKSSGYYRLRRWHRRVAKDNDKPDIDERRDKLEDLDYHRYTPKRFRVLEYLYHFDGNMTDHFTIEELKKHLEFDVEPVIDEIVEYTDWIKNYERENKIEISIDKGGKRAYLGYMAIVGIKV